MNTKITSVITKRYRIITNDNLIRAHQKSIDAQNQLYNYAVKYLEKTYGYKHLSDKYFPSKLIAKRMLIVDIINGYLEYYYNLTRWNTNLIGLHSQAAREFLTTVITNFGEYRKILYKASLMTDKEKYHYLTNQDRNNPRHKTWYCKGSLKYLHHQQSFKTVALPSNGYLKVISNHHIKVQGFGIIQTRENLKNLKTENLVISKIKHKYQDQYELQLVIKKTINRQHQLPPIGADWNLTDDKIYHLSNNQKFYLDKDVSKKADELENKLNQLKSQRDSLFWLSNESTRVVKLNQAIKYLSLKRSNLIKEFYYHLAKQILSLTDTLILEQLDSKSMRFKASPTSRGFNRKLAKIKPYELTQIILNTANQLGKTVILVDSYKTSQVEHGTTEVHKHSLAEREWTSKLTGQKIDRDYNASLNILDWGLNPKQHIKLRDYPNIKPTNLITTN